MSHDRRYRGRHDGHKASRSGHTMKCGGKRMPRIEETRAKHPEDPFLSGNWRIEKAVKRFLKEQNDANHVAVLSAIKQRILDGGHLLSPVIIDETGENFEFRLIQTDDGKLWQVGFMSKEEFDKGAPSECLSNFMDVTFDACMETDAAGMILNPWGDMPFTLPIDLIRTLKLCIILENSDLWIPCRTVLGESDAAKMNAAVREAEASGNMQSLIGMEFTNDEPIRFIPDILQHGEDLLFPAFTAAEEMGEYGDGFSKIEKPFPEIIRLAENNEQHPVGIVIDPYTNPFLLRKELYELVISSSKRR